MFTELRKLVLDKWNDWDLGQRPSNLSFIRRGSTWLGQGGKEVYFIFRYGDEVPLLIAKTVTSASYGETIRKEANNVSFVWNNFSKTIRSSITQQLGLSELNGMPIYFERSTPGIAFPEKVTSCWKKNQREELLNLPL